MTEYVDTSTLPPLPLPSGITSRYLDCSPASLIFHILESKPTSPTSCSTGHQTRDDQYDQDNQLRQTQQPDQNQSSRHDDKGRPRRILLVHGFPELAYSWRHMMPLLSQPNNTTSYPGAHVVAFDQRGFGRTHPTSTSSPLPQSTFRPLNLIRDTMHLVSALGWDYVDIIVGHDFGAVTAHICALARPDLLRSVVLMSHPTKGEPGWPLAVAQSTPTPPSTPKEDIHAALLSLPTPRKHYKWYYCTPPAPANLHLPLGSPLTTFLRGYFHLKSADWQGNRSPLPHRLQSWSAPHIAIMPRYYVMDADTGMRENVARDMAHPTAQRELESHVYDRWLDDPAMAVYVSEYGRTSFAGGLHWYKVQTDPSGVGGDTQAYAGKVIEVPCAFVAGVADWGHWQEPGAVEAMEANGTRGESGAADGSPQVRPSVGKGWYMGTHVVEGAGHWVNQEQPGKCVEIVKMVMEAGLDGSLARNIDRNTPGWKM